MDTIRLNDAEERIARWIGKQRSDANRAAGVPDGRMSAQSGESIDVNGFGAELAFCKLFNLYPDFEIRPRRGSADCERFGEAIDVKATTYPEGRLLAVSWKSVLAADVYALLVVDWPAFRFAGFARAAELLQPSRLKDVAGRPGYAMDQAELSPEQLPLRFERRRTV